MNISHFLSAALTALFLALPSPAWSRDRGDHGHHKGGHGWHGDHHKHSGHHHGHGSSHYRGYGYPYRGYGYGYPYRGYGYGYPYAGFGLSFTTRPSYYYSSRVYNGRPAYGYSDSLAADVQQELRRRGYYRGSIDGDIGPASRAAIRRYQADRGLSVTGRIDSTLLRSLDID
jgi:hypothetical protein